MSSASHGKRTLQLFIAATAVVLLLVASHAHAGNIFLTGHDVDFHRGQRGFDTVVLDFLRGATCGGGVGAIDRVNYKIAVVGSGQGFWRWSDYTTGGVSSGVATPPMPAKPGFGPVTYYNLTGGGTNWADVLANDALVILSHTSCVGCDLDDPGSAEINAHMSDILARFNAGMDLWVNAAADSNTYYDFLPPGFAATGGAISGSLGFVATTAGAGIGLTPTMLNYFPTHTSFASYSSALTVMETRPASNNAVISLGACNVNFATVVDHLECYKVRDQGPRLSGVVNLDSRQFGLAEGCRIGKARKFCVPVKKIVVQTTPAAVPFEGQDLRDDRICYTVKCPPLGIDVDAEDQFGPRHLGRLKPFELCTPARKTPPGQIAVFKINDLNGNGIRDPNEPVVPGWVITISNSTTGFSASATTDASGLASFYPISAGSYTVTETPQSGWTATGPTTQTVTVPPNKGVSVYFFNRQAFPSQIYVRKYKDLDGDGVRDPGEPGIPGWPITITGPGGLVNGTTNAGGVADFWPVPAGSYVVAEGTLPGWSATGPTSYSVNLPPNVGMSFEFGNRCTCGTMDCGNGVLDPCEQCDDGNTMNGDGCNECCFLEQPPTCGDLVVTPPEQCDPPGSASCPSGAACNPDCTCPAPLDCEQSAPACNGACDIPGQVCFPTTVMRCEACNTPCVTNADCGPGCGNCIATTDCHCLACDSVCVGGSSSGAPCTSNAQCPGGGSCTTPACCCFPNGMPACTTDAQCGGVPGSCQCP